MNEIISSYLDAVARKDPSVVDRFFDPDVEYMVNGATFRGFDETLPPISAECGAALPWLGLYRGRDALRGFLEHMHRNVDITKFGPLEVISESDRGAAFGWFRLRAVSTGRTCDIAFAVKFKIKNGLISEYHFLENTFDVANAYRVGGSWTMATDDSQHKVPALSIQSFTSSETGAWSNAYLITGQSDAILYDVFMLRSDAVKLADVIETSGKTLQMVIISHAHPDHFMGLEIIADRFPGARIVATENVVADLRADGPWMLSVVQQKAGTEAPTRLVIPEILTAASLDLEGHTLEIVEFGESESKHIACLYIPEMRGLFCADLLYNNAHAYLQERHLTSWLARLDELEAFVKNRISAIYPGHGPQSDASLIEQTRAYLRDFEAAVRLGDGSRAQEQMIAKYPDYHVKQFLTGFSIPAYFPGRESAQTHP